MKTDDNQYCNKCSTAQLLLTEVTASSFNY